MEQEYKKGGVNETLYSERYIPFSEKHEEFYHEYYAQVPARFKNWDGNSLWHHAQMFMTGVHINKFEEGNESIPEKKYYDKTLECIGVAGDRLSGNMDVDRDRATPLSDQKIIYIPYIEGHRLILGINAVSSCETLIVHGDFDEIIFNLDELNAAHDGSFFKMKNLWFYGSLNSLQVFPYSLENVRIPSTVDTINSDNTVNIIGLDSVLKEHDDAFIRLAEPPRL